MEDLQYKKLSFRNVEYIVQQGTANKSRDLGLNLIRLILMYVFL